MSTESPDNRVPLRLVFSLMVLTIGGLLGALLGYAGVRYGFKWPGLAKSVVSGILLIACVVYGSRRGNKDMKLVQEMHSADYQVGIAHAGLIILFIFVLTAFAAWIFVGPPLSVVKGPLG